MQFTKAGSEAIEHDGEASTGAYLYSLPCGKGSCSSKGCSWTRPSTFGRLRDASHVSGTFIGRHADTRARVGREQPPTHASRRTQAPATGLDVLLPPPAPSSPRPDAPRPRTGRADWGVMELPAEPHVRRTPDRLRGKTGRSERCSSGCCGRLSARATRTPKPLPTAPGDRPISRRRRASGACCGARDLRRHHPFGARSACTSSSSRNLATSRASFLVSSRSSASSAVAAVIPSRAFALPSLKKCLN